MDGLQAVAQLVSVVKQNLEEADNLDAFAAVKLTPEQKAELARIDKARRDIALAAAIVFSAMEVQTYAANMSMVQQRLDDYHVVQHCCLVCNFCDAQAMNNLTAPEIIDKLSTLVSDCQNLSSDIVDFLASIPTHSTAYKVGMGVLGFLALLTVIGSGIVAAHLCPTCVFFLPEAWEMAIPAIIGTCFVGMSAAGWFSSSKKNKFSNAHKALKDKLKEIANDLDAMKAHGLNLQVGIQKAAITPVALVDLTTELGKARLLAISLSNVKWEHK